MSNEENLENQLEGQNSVLTLEEDDDVQRECKVCNEIPDSIICLSCSHCICLRCAGSHLIKKEEPSIEEFECPLCGEYTLLSEEIQEALILMFQNGEFNPEEMEEDEEMELEDHKIEEGEEEEDHKALSVGEIIDNLDQFDGNLSKEEGEEEEYPTETQEDEYQEESSRDDEDYKSTDRAGSASSEISLHFICMDHPNEEYCYYSPGRRKLLCPKCVIQYANSENENDARPLRKCIPLILQHFEDFLNTVEVSKSLTGNQVKEIEIKSEEIKGRVESLRNKIELKFEEIYDSLHEMKDSVLMNFDKNWALFFEQLEGCNQYLDKKIGQFDQILEQIGEIQTSSESITEDLLGFFFSNQEELEETVRTEEDKHEYNEFIKDYHDRTNRIEQKLAQTFENSHQAILNQVKSHFEEILDPEVNNVKRESEKMMKTIKSNEGLRRGVSDEIKAMKSLLNTEDHREREKEVESDYSNFQERAMKLRQKLDGHVVPSSNSLTEQTLPYERKSPSTIRNQLSPPNLKLEVDRNMFTLNNYFKNKTTDPSLVDPLLTSKFERMFSNGQQQPQSQLNVFQKKIEILKKQNLSNSLFYPDGLKSAKSSFSFRKRGFGLENFSSSKNIYNDNDIWKGKDSLRNSRYLGQKPGKSAEMRSRVNSVYSRQPLWEEDSGSKLADLKNKLKLSMKPDHALNNRYNYSNNKKTNGFVRNKSSNLGGSNFKTYSFNKSGSIKNIDFDFKPISRIDVKDFKMFRERVRNKFGKSRIGDRNTSSGYSNLGF